MKLVSARRQFPRENFPVVFFVLFIAASSMLACCGHRPGASAVSASPAAIRQLPALAKVSILSEDLEKRTNRGVFHLAHGRPFQILAEFQSDLPDSVAPSDFAAKIKGVPGLDVFPFHRRISSRQILSGIVQINDPSIRFQPSALEIVFENSRNLGQGEAPVFVALKTTGPSPGNVRLRACEPERLLISFEDSAPPGETSYSLQIDKGRGWEMLVKIGLGEKNVWIPRDATRPMRICGEDPAGNQGWTKPFFGRIADKQVGYAIATPEPGEREAAKIVADRFEKIVAENGLPFESAGFIGFWGEFPRYILHISVERSDLGFNAVGRRWSAKARIELEDICANKKYPSQKEAYVWGNDWRKNALDERKAQYGFQARIADPVVEDLFIDNPQLRGGK